jgi:hypothetical protein
MSKERVIVYIDENTDDGMMWEELNQEGQMQVSVYDEEYEYDVEYHHSIIVKSLQEYLSDYTKQVRKEVCEEIRNKLKENGLLYTWKGEPKYKTMEELLDQIQGER